MTGRQELIVYSDLLKLHDGKRLHQQLPQPCQHRLYS